MFRGNGVGGGHPRTVCRHFLGALQLDRGLSKSMWVRSLVLNPSSHFSILKLFKVVSEDIFCTTFCAAVCGGKLFRLHLITIRSLQKPSLYFQRFPVVLDTTLFNLTLFLLANPQESVDDLYSTSRLKTRSAFWLIGKWLSSSNTILPRFTLYSSKSLKKISVKKTCECPFDQSGSWRRDRVRLQLPSAAVVAKSKREKEAIFSR